MAGAVLPDVVDAAFGGVPYAPRPRRPPDLMLVLVRHGQTAVNAGGRLQGRIDAPLTDVGRSQAAAAAAAVLAVATPARVITSPLLRARETAAAFGVTVE